jgi:hypothetical protein
VLGDIQCVVVFGKIAASLSSMTGPPTMFVSSELKRDVLVGKLKLSVGEGVGLGSPDLE